MFSPNSRILSLTVFTAAILFCIASFPAFADSHIRIVRLSGVVGGVQISHGDASGYQKAMINLPITEGMKLRTSDDGRAEIEFEDGSAIRIVPDSAIEFPQLSLRDSGAKVSGVQITRGTAYVDFAGTKNDEFSVQFGSEKIALSHAAHFRIDLGKTSNAIAVFKGLIEVTGPAGDLEVKKAQTANFDSSDNGKYKLAKNVSEEPWDSWDDQQNEYRSQYAKKSYNSYSPYSYGTTDLAYYGNFFNYPGYGMMWQPYFAGAGWDPFMNGAWSSYPGWGYGWISSYPWGWTPYHYGTWVFLPSQGWAWQPGGAWSAWYSQPQLLNAPAGFVAPHAPTAGTGTVFVNRGTASTFSGDRVVLRSNSAGLGIPRGELPNMAKVSKKAQNDGMVTGHIEPAMSASGNRMGGAGGGRASGAYQGRAGSSRASEAASHAGGTAGVGSRSAGAGASGAASPHK